jgi:hypothetical protein
MNSGLHALNFIFQKPTFIASNITLAQHEERLGGIMDIGCVEHDTHIYVDVSEIAVMTNRREKLVDSAASPKSINDSDVLITAVLTRALECQTIDASTENNDVLRAMLAGAQGCLFEARTGVWCGIYMTDPPTHFILCNPTFNQTMFSRQESSTLRSVLTGGCNPEEVLFISSVPSKISLRKTLLQMYIEEYVGTEKELFESKDATKIHGRLEKMQQCHQLISYDVTIAPAMTQYVIDVLQTERTASSVVIHSVRIRQQIIDELNSNFGKTPLFREAVLKDIDSCTRFTF